MQTIISIISIIAGIFFGGIGAYCCYNYLNRPTAELLAKFTEWLLYAVTEAEKQLGAGTGQIKLRYVYNMALDKFPSVIKFISFESFSNAVDVALNKMKEMVKSNEKLQEYIEG